MPRMASAMVQGILRTPAGTPPLENSMEDPSPCRRLQFAEALLGILCPQRDKCLFSIQSTHQLPSAILGAAIVPRRSRRPGVGVSLTKRCKEGIPDPVANLLLLLLLGFRYLREHRPSVGASGRTDLSLGQPNTSCLAWSPARVTPVPS